MTAVMLVEDHASFRQAIAFLLDEHSEFKEIVQAGTLTEARRLLDKEIAVAVVDLGLPDGSGAEFIEEFRRLNPESVTLVLTASMDPEETSRAVEAGADDVLRKSAGVVEIVETVRRLAPAR